MANESNRSRPALLPRFPRKKLKQKRIREEETQAQHRLKQWKEGQRP